MPGPQTPVGHAIWFLGPDMQGAGTVDGNFTLSEIPSGFYSVWIPETIFDNPVRYFRHPDANISPMYFIVSPDSIATVNVSSVQAFMGGAVSLHGSTSLGEVSTISFGALGSGDASGGQAWTDIDAASGAYQLIVSPGPWSPNLGLSWQNDLPPDRYLNEHLSLSDWGHTATFAAGETVTYHPTYRFGCVTIKVSILGGGALSHPPPQWQLRVPRPPNQILWTYNFTASSRQSDVTQGLVNFHGAAGNCQLSAAAVVNGAWTQFGNVNVTVVPDVCQEIDIGGPSLRVQLPAPGSWVVQNNVVVTGVATDDVGVVSVAINGVQATLSSTHNPTDPAEVAFTATVPLPNAGANTLITVATDVSGKTASDTRTVHRDAYLPVLAWTPADNTSSNAVQIQVQGTATDERGGRHHHRQWTGRRPSVHRECR